MQSTHKTSHHISGPHGSPNRVVSGSAIATPPVFTAVIKKNSFTWIYTTRRALLFAADIRHFCINALFCKFFCRNPAASTSFSNIIFRRTNKTRYIISADQDQFPQSKRPHQVNLLFLKIVAPKLQFPSISKTSYGDYRQYHQCPALANTFENRQFLPSGCASPSKYGIIGCIPAPAK